MYQLLLNIPWIEIGKALLIVIIVANYINVVQAKEPNIIQRSQAAALWVIAICILTGTLKP